MAIYPGDVYARPSVHETRLEDHARPPSFAALARQLPPVVYFLRTPDGLVKIGHTAGNLGQRRQTFRAQWEDVLALLPGSRADEAAMHRRFRRHLARGREFFQPAPEVIDYINELRAGMGLSPVRWHRAA